MRQLKITKQITSRESLSLEKYLQEIGKFPLLTPEEEEQLPKRIKEGDEAALKRFIEGNLRFVISVAKQYQASGERLDDLINAGNLGLIKAATRFDASRGFKFISFGVWWIRQSILQHLTENGKAIRLPANKVAIVNKIRNTSILLEQKLQRTPTPDEIADKMFEDEEKKGNKKLELDSLEVEQMLAVSSNLPSLDAPVADDSELTFIDYVEAESLNDVNVSMNNVDLQIMLKRVLSKRLSIREREVLIMNFGLFGEQPKTLEEIGERFELTRERVRQIREKSLRRLKQMGSTKIIKEYI